MHVLIVGNGIAGATAARHVRKGSAEARITMLSDEGADPFARTALMYVYMGVLTEAHTHLYERRFWDESRIERAVGRAVGLDPGGKLVALADGSDLAYDRLLVASGSVPLLPAWPGAERPGVQGLYHRADLARMDAATAGVRAAVVVGGGLIGVELAEMLRTRGIAVTFLVREPTYLPRVFTPDESARVEAEIRRHGVDLRMGAEVAAVLGSGETGPVEAIETAAGERLPAGFVGVGTGVRPNVAWVGDALHTRRGVLVDEALRASAADVFAAGDCAELVRPPAGEPARRPIWYTARAQGAVAARGLLGRPVRYRPGVFYNSAKFFDLEWQTVGQVDPAGPGETDVVVSDAGRSLRVRYRTDDSRAVVGVSALGVRVRVDVWTEWIEQGRSVEQVRAALAAGTFDGELTRPLAGAR